MDLRVGAPAAIDNERANGTLRRVNSKALPARCRLWYLPAEGGLGHPRFEFPGQRIEGLGGQAGQRGAFGRAQVVAGQRGGRVGKQDRAAFNLASGRANDGEDGFGGNGGGLIL